jgi:hypothetical protein
MVHSKTTPMRAGRIHESTSSVDSQEAYVCSAWCRGGEDLLNDALRSEMLWVHGMVPHITLHPRYPRIRERLGMIIPTD